MSFLGHFRNVKESYKAAAIDKLIRNSTPDYDFFLMVILSVLMATAGLLLDNVTVVLGSALIAPVLYPILSLSLGMTMADYKLIGRAFYTIVKSAAIGIVTAFVITLLFEPVMEEVPFEIILRTGPSLLTFMVAITAGIAVSVALVRPDLNATIPGLAISVALIPPLSTIGIGLAWLDWNIMSGAVVLFVLNVLGIVFASLASFSLLNLYVKRDVAKEVVQEEDARVKLENWQAELVSKGDKESVQETEEIRKEK